MGVPARSSSGDEYHVRFKDASGKLLAQGVATAKSPRRALDVFCKELRREVIHVTKYNSWRSLVSACWYGSTLCEVTLVRGEHKNFYLLYTKAIM